MARQLETTCALCDCEVFDMSSRQLSPRKRNLCFMTDVWHSSDFQENLNPATLKPSSDLLIHIITRQATYERQWLETHELNPVDPGPKTL